MAVEARRVIRATPDRIFAHVGRVEHLPRYAAPLWMTVEATERQRIAHVVTLTGYLIGLPIESVQRIVLRAPTTLEFKQIRGTLRALSGRCTLEAVEDGTEVRYRLEADVGIPMVTDDGARQFLVQVVEHMLDRIKLAAERRAPVRRASRGAAPTAVALDGEEEDQAEEPSPVGPPAGGGGDRGAPIAAQESREQPHPPADAAPVARPIPRGRPSAGPPQPGQGAEPRKSRGRRRRRHRGRGGDRRGPAPAGPSAAPPPSG